MKNTSNKLLVICGPTSSGKTSLALKLAKKFNGEIISADSRQVFQSMDIGTGKDLPQSSEITYEFEDEFGYYDIKGIKVWGYDLVDPKEAFSVSQYIDFSRKIINRVLSNNSLPILVGGTGLYIKGVVDGIQTASIPTNKLLRQKLETKSVEELFEMLSQMDAIKAGSLNSSDRKNPRRLVRAIEIATSKIDHIENSFEKNAKKFNPLFVGLTVPKDLLFQKIDERVEERVKTGIKKEINTLLKNGVSWDDQSMSSLGYGIWKDYFEGNKSEDKIIVEWKNQEKSYTKRQMTWFKKEKRINWIDPTKNNHLLEVEKLVEKWYKSN